MDELKKLTTNECFAIDLATKEIVARVNSLSVIPGSALVIQIAYDDGFARARAGVLRLHRYEVLTIFGNDAAKIVLNVHQQCDLFIVGHAAPEETRRDIVIWLKEHYADVPLLALNSPSVTELSGADYNVAMNGPETLLPIIATALASTGHSPSCPAR